MKYVKKDLGAYKLHLIKTTNFKTIKIRVSFRSPIVKEEITLRNVLCSLLTLSTKKYQTKRDLIIKGQDLYAATISSSNSRIGNYINTDILLTVLHDKYTEEGNFKSALDFLYDVIYDPNVEGNHFNEEQLEIVKRNAKTSLESLKEDASYYSLLRLYENMEDSGPLSCRMAGYIEDLDAVGSKNLYQYYKNMINKDLMDIFVIGDIDFHETEEMIKSIFRTKTFKKQKLGYYLEEEKPRKHIRTVIEQEVNNQSKLAIGARLCNLTKYERDYPLTLYNVILGAGPDSKLFREVREKHSLCYTINSVPNKLDNMLVIRAGIDKKNIKKTVSLIQSQMNLMKKGKFNDKDLTIAKEYFQTAMDSILESQSSIIESYYMMDLVGLDDMETRVEKMMEVTSNDIVKVAKKIKLDTVYCLEGVKE